MSALSANTEITNSTINSSRAPFVLLIRPNDALAKVASAYAGSKAAESTNEQHKHRQLT